MGFIYDIPTASALPTSLLLHFAILHFFIPNAENQGTKNLAYCHIFFFLVKDLFNYFLIVVSRHC